MLNMEKQDLDQTQLKGVFMSFAERAEKIIEEFKQDPRNKVFVDFETLIASATEETGQPVSGEVLTGVIKAYLEGDMNGDQESIYDGAVYACGHLARACLGDNPDDDIDYEVEWIEEEDGKYSAQVMLS